MILKMYKHIQIVILLQILQFTISTSSIDSNIRFFYRSNIKSNIVLSNENLTLKNADIINSNYPVIMIVHGWLDDINAELFSILSDSYFKLQECTIILVDWCKYSKNFYLISALNVPSVGDAIGTFLSQPEFINLDLTKLHMIGFSLGAHICGNAARMIQTLTGITIARLTALDPAGLYFTILPQIIRRNYTVQPTDAILVDVLHTSLFSGSIKRMGKSDFYANPSFISLQPGCTILEYCSHVRSYIYFNESILSCGFLAYPVGNNGESVVYGQHMNVNTTGVFTFTTNSNYPYAKNKSTCLV